MTTRHIPLPVPLVTVLTNSGAAFKLWSSGAPVR